MSAKERVGWFGGAHSEILLQTNRKVRTDITKKKITKTARPLGVVVISGSVPS